ncbi:MAG: class I tRNA ligase family protein, partial [Planctomycetota bacterium]
LSDRSKTVIEPLVSEQWFVKMEPLAGPAIEAVKNGALDIRPERWTKVYLDWLENVRDWCISRQLWWGHRIPVWYDEDGNAVALHEDPADGAVHPESGKPLVRQDEDVLDTWASSWLWPMSTLGWPDAGSADYEAFYPTHFLSTAREIIYLWVARMVMAGYHLDGRCPFDTVYIHATILDAKGRRMSKSAGNGIDPVDMVNQYGADAVRFTLVEMTTEGQDVRLAETRFETGRNFMNKVWNAGRFTAAAGGDQPVDQPELSALAVEDRWILDRLDAVTGEVGEHLRHYRFHDYARTMYQFIWNELCDWYLEIIKPRLEGETDAAAAWTLRTVYGTALRLLQPACPFITEEMSQRLRLLPDGVEAVARAPWPTAGTVPVDADAVTSIDLMRNVVTAVRNLRAEYRVPESAKLDLLVCGPEDACERLLTQSVAVRRLGRIENLSVGTALERPKMSAVAHLDGDVEVCMPLEGLIDLEAERARLRKEMEKVEKNVQGLDRKLGNEKFLANAAPDVVERDRERRDEQAALLERLKASLEGLGDQ